MSRLFYCFLVQFDRVVLKKKSFFPGSLLGWVPMSLCPYGPICPYIPMSLVLMSPVWISKPVVL